MSLDYEYDGGESGDGQVTLGDTIEDDRPGVEEKTQYNEMLEMVANASWLTEIQRECVVLHFRDNMNFSEIAREKGMSRANTNKAFRRAMTTIRERLNAE